MFTLLTVAAVATVPTVATVGLRPIAEHRKARKSTKCTFTVYSDFISSAHDGNVLTFEFCLATGHHCPDAPLSSLASWSSCFFLNFSHPFMRIRLRILSITSFTLVAMGCHGAKLCYPGEYAHVIGCSPKTYEFTVYAFP